MEKIENPNFANSPANTARALPCLVRRLLADQDLCRVAGVVSPVLEIAALTNRECKSPGGGRALLFQRVEGFDLPVLTNTFGSSRRAALAWGQEAPELLAERLAQSLSQAPGTDAEARLHHLVHLEEGSGSQVDHLRLPEAPLDLGQLPALKNWPGDGGRYLTLGLASMRDEALGTINYGIYRMQILDARRCAVHFLRHSLGARLVADYQRRQKPLPLAVTLGGDPALLAAAALSLPTSIDEGRFLEILRSQPLRLAAAPWSGLPVAADAEVILDGEIVPGEWASEGPFGNHTGFYQPVAPAPVFHLRGLFRAEEALFPATVVGPPPMENAYLVRSGEPLLLALLQADYPQIRSLRFLTEGVFHGCAVLGLQAEAVRKPLELARELWRSGPLRRSRLLLLIDAEDEVGEGAHLLWRVINQVRPERDLLEDEGRLAVDATRKHSRAPVLPDESVLADIERRWRESGLD